MAVIYSNHFVQFFDDDGNPLSGGKLYAYSAGTTTAKATYTTEDESTQHSNPIILDSSGRATIFIEGSYRFDLYDSNDVLIDSTDDVTSFSTLSDSGDPFFESFSGDASTTIFTLSESLGTDSKDIMVFYDAGGNEGYEIQNPSAYTLSGTALTFGSAPASGTDNVYVFAPTKLLGAASASAAASSASAAASAASATTSLVGTGFQYGFDTDTTATDPGTGDIKFDNATLSSVTEIYVSETTDQSQSIGEVFATWDDSTSTVKGTITIFEQADQTNFVVFNLDAVTDNGGWETFDVTYVDSGGSFSADDTLTVKFSRIGDKGDTGPTGPAGSIDAVGSDIDMNGNQMQWSKGADVASATALPVLTDGNYFDVTGTTTITSINTTGGAGTVIKLHFDDALTLTHHATDLILPGGANITTAAGDEAEFVEYAAGDYRCTSYTKADGTSVVSAGGNTWDNSGFASGRYYMGIGYRNIDSTFAMTADRMYARPFVIGNEGTFTEIGVVVTTGSGGSSIRMGIYNMVNGVPDTLVLDAGTLSSATTGEKTISISQELGPGTYMLACVSDGTPTVEYSSTEASLCTHLLGMADPSSSLSYGVYRSFTYAALPTPFGGTLTYLTSGSAFPGMFMKI